MTTGFFAYLRYRTTGPRSSLFELALRDYERQTGAELVKYPLAGRLEDCHSVESAVNVFQEQVRVIGNLQGGQRQDYEIPSWCSFAFVHTFY